MKTNIKTRMQKTLSFIICLLMCISSLLLTSCQSTEPLVIKESDTYIVISVSEESLGENDELFLIDYMKTLKENGELEFELDNGMIKSINGIDNPADFSKCWMLYTSDTENSGSAFGTVEYKDKLYGSAIVGAELLKIKPNNIYIWVFKAFD